MSSLEGRVIEKCDITESRKKCKSCGKVKPDVKSRSWNGVDAWESDILCASCVKKKERYAGYYLMGYTGFVVVGIIIIAFIASGILGHIY